MSQRDRHEVLANCLAAYCTFKFTLHGLNPAQGDRYEELADWHTHHQKGGEGDYFELHQPVSDRLIRRCLKVDGRVCWGGWLDRVAGGATTLSCLPARLLSHDPALPA